MGKKKPDMVVEQPQIMEYPTNVGAPAFTVPDVITHKDKRGKNATNFIQSKFDKIKDQYLYLIELTEDTRLVYNSKYNFIPIVGRKYHLYVGSDGGLFLSMIKPNEWNMEHVGSFNFSIDNTWERC